MENQEIPGGPYRATKLWNEAIRTFRNGMPLKKHWKHMRQHENCFSASEAIQWLCESLKKNPHFGPTITKEQTMKLLRKFLKEGLFAHVRKVENIPDAVCFKDNGDLFRFTNKTPFRSLRSPMRMQLVSVENISANEAEAPVEDVGCSPQLCGATTKSSDGNKPSANREELEEYTLVARILSVAEIEAIWKDFTLDRLASLLGTTNIGDLLNISSINPQWIIHNMTRVGSSGIVLPLNAATDNLDQWIMCAMDSLANWPNRAEGFTHFLQYPGFERDVFNIIKDYFIQEINPLTTFGLYDAFCCAFLQAELLDINCRMINRKDRGHGIQRDLETTPIDNLFGYNLPASESVENLMMDMTLGTIYTSTPLSELPNAMRPRLAVGFDTEIVDPIPQVKMASLISSKSFVNEQQRCNTLPRTDSSTYFETVFMSASPVTRIVSKESLGTIRNYALRRHKAYQAIYDWQSKISNKTKSLESLSCKSDLTNFTHVSGTSLESAPAVLERSSRCQKKAYCRPIRSQSNDSVAHQEILSRSNSLRVTNSNKCEYVLAKSQHADGISSTDAVLHSYQPLKDDFPPDDEDSCSTGSQKVISPPFKKSFVRNSIRRTFKGVSSLKNSAKQKRLIIQNKQNNKLIHVRTNSGGYVNPALSQSLESLSISKQDGSLDYSAATRTVNDMVKFAQEHIPNNVQTLENSQNVSNSLYETAIDNTINTETKTVISDNLFKIPSTSKQAMPTTTVSSGRGGPVPTLTSQERWRNHLESPRIVTEAGMSLAQRSFQFLCLLLPPGNRRKLHYLLTFAKKIIQNPNINLDANQSNQSVVYHSFLRAILCSREEADFDELLSLRIVTFLADNHCTILQPSSELKTMVEQQIIELQTSKPRLKRVSSNGGPIFYCHQVTKDDYQQKDHTHQALLDLLDQVINNSTMKPKDRKKQLKRFEETYPEVYKIRFPMQPFVENNPAPVFQRFRVDRLRSSLRL